MSLIVTQEKTAGGYPVERLRRLRRSEGLRALVRETHVTPDDLIYPLFVTHGSGVQREITSMPGQYQLSPDMLPLEATLISELGIRAVILFGLPESKDPVGRESFRPDGIVQRAVRVLKDAVPDLIVITDVCLCQYTSHGHCGIVDEAGYVLNDETLEVLQTVAVSHAEAGADVVAPSGMIDGMVKGIRQALDERDFAHLPILSYAVKYASAFYGPFREAADGAPSFGDRRTHQMDPANGREALREARLDVGEGADMLMVKPALAYLDIIRQLRDEHPAIPIAAYNVSGEYAMLKAAAQNGWIDERKAVLETLIGMKRAGADLIITYHAKDAARWFRGL